MCGIFGFINSNNKTNFNSINTINNLVNLLSHRGPDFKDTYINKDRSIFLGHTRLSILDLSSNGNQPMISNQGRYVIIYNGEIYNHLDLREELKIKNKVTFWKGSSDTETILNCIDIWGIHKTIPKLNGMFSIAIYDIQNENIYLVRDKFGEKPLYYGFVNNSFIFSSELKPITAFPNFKNQISLDSLSLYFQLNYIPSPKSIYNNIFKLEKGNILSIKVNKLKHNLSNKNYNHNIFDFYKWWDFTLNSNRDFPDNYNYFEKLEKALHNSVKRQLISDVPIGSFLSGGIDSSLVTAIMKEYSNNKINTYTVGFQDKSYDESKYASKIANYLGTNHNEIILQKNEIINSFSKMSEVYDEPFADSSQIPTYLVSNFASKHIKVALTGDGADELFGGYNRYKWVQTFNKRKFLFYIFKNKNFFNLIKIIPNNIWTLIENFLKLNSNDNGVSLLQDKIFKLFQSCINSKDSNELYLNLLKNWKDDDLLIKNKKFENSNFFNKYYLIDQKKSLAEKMMLFDINNYLTDDILCKVDRAAMSNSLETRAPMLDYEVVNIASKIPTSLKINNNTNKYILKQLLHKYMPQKYFVRSKMGFSIPIGKYLKYEIKEWAEELVNDTKFNPHLEFLNVKKIWSQHLTGKYNWEYKIWSILIFQSWYNQYK